MRDVTEDERIDDGDFMKVTNLGLPEAFYYFCLHPNGRQAPFDALEHSAKNIVGPAVLIVGGGFIANLLQQTLRSHRVIQCASMDLDTIDLAQIDSIVLGVSPVHYRTVLATLQEKFANISCPIYEIFENRRSLEPRIVVETQPRSGTGYVIKNLATCLGIPTASTFSGAGRTPCPDGILFQDNIPNDQPFLIKTHFFHPLFQLRYRFVDTIYLAAYPFDSYYSWGKLLARSQDENYRLLSNSPEWNILRGYLELNRDWLFWASRSFFLRYADFYLDFPKTIQKLENYIGQCSLAQFERPRKNEQRSYWSNRYSPSFDQGVFTELQETFHDAIEQFWPEKSGKVSYT